jgi:thiamine-phosphate pyrophosphorylase
VAVAPPFTAGVKPWFVTGGVAPDTLDEVLATGARRVVVVRALTDAADPDAVAAELAERLAAA